MFFLFWVVISLVVSAIHIARDQEPRTVGRVATIILLWWFVIAIAGGLVIGGFFHIFDGPETAKGIGFTRGDGGFQTEVGASDIAIGVGAFLCYFFRDRFWLAVGVIASISALGAALGHVYQLVENDNHAPDNAGVTLYLDFLTPVVIVVLLCLATGWRQGADRRAERDVATSA